jgi:hypothetical protein
MKGIGERHMISRWTIKWLEIRKAVKSMEKNPRIMKTNLTIRAMKNNIRRSNVMIWIMIISSMTMMGMMATLIRVCLPLSKMVS